MTRRVAVDTNVLVYFFADERPLDESRLEVVRRAKRTLNALLRAEETLLLPFPVLVEFANVMHAKKGRRAVELVESLLLDKRFSLVPSDVHVAGEALVLAQKTGVKYSDCLVYLTAREGGATALFTFDKEFSVLGGLDVLP